MKVLFISSGNSSSGISPIVYNQGKSLEYLDINVSFFLIKGKGIRGYIKNIFILRKFLKHKSFDIIHAHYALSGYIAGLAGAQPLIVSLMGSDVFEKPYSKLLIKIFHFLIWKNIIVKSESLKYYLNINNLFIIPNGINIKTFRPINKFIARNVLKLEKNYLYVLFGSDPLRYEKNYNLLKSAIELLKTEIVKVIFLKNIQFDKVVLYMNASDVLVLTSKWEGSPNVIKEAMACNTPIVTTDVGDVKWVIGNIEGCYISTFNPQDFAYKLSLALNFSVKKGKTLGRDRLIKLGLDDKSIAMKLFKIYQSTLHE